MCETSKRSDTCGMPLSLVQSFTWGNNSWLFRKTSASNQRILNNLSSQQNNNIIQQAVQVWSCTDTCKFWVWSLSIQQSRTDINVVMTIKSAYTVTVLNNSYKTSIYETVSLQKETHLHTCAVIVYRKKIEAEKSR